MGGLRLKVTASESDPAYLADVHGGGGEGGRNQGHGEAQELPHPILGVQGVALAELHLKLGPPGEQGLAAWGEARWGQEAELPVPPSKQEAHPGGQRSDRKGEGV